MFVTRRLPGNAVDRLAEEHEVDVWDGPLPPPREELLARAAECEGLLALLTDRVDAELLDACPRLRAVANMAVGTDNVDLEEAERRGVAVGNTPGVLTETTADLAFALILAAARRVSRRPTRSARASGAPGSPRDGSVAMCTGRRSGSSARARSAPRSRAAREGFAMRVLLNGREEGPGRVPLEELLAESDFVSLHAPLTEETRHLIGEEALRAMRPTAILVNTGRGELVDQVALRRALEEGWIAGAGLDVTTPSRSRPTIRCSAPRT